MLNLDKILDKISDNGVDSLNSEEKEYLDYFSKKTKKEEYTNTKQSLSKVVPEKDKGNDFFNQYKKKLFNKIIDTQSLVTKEDLLRSMSSDMILKIKESNYDISNLCEDVNNLMKKVLLFYGADSYFSLNPSVEDMKKVTREHFSNDLKKIEKKYNFTTDEVDKII